MTPAEIDALPVGSRLHNTSTAYLPGADWVRFEDGWHLIEQEGDFTGKPAGHDWSESDPVPVKNLSREAADLVLVP